MTELFNGLRVIRDAQAAGRDAGLGAGNEIAGEDLRRFHRPQP
jgi:hypothetical protein